MLEQTDQYLGQEESKILKTDLSMSKNNQSLNNTGNQGRIQSKSIRDSIKEKNMKRMAKQELCSKLKTIE